ncbi:MAG: hypothetical protein EAZ95_02040 [Bacteroidetes bacterium]|nr:MAG: hypothetical protein EAZ95_02040 [Bacteroidota bacterium]
MYYFYIPSKLYGSKTNKKSTLTNKICIFFMYERFHTLSTNKKTCPKSDIFLLKQKHKLLIINILIFWHIFRKYSRQGRTRFTSRIATCLPNLSIL